MDAQPGRERQLAVQLDALDLRDRRAPADHRHRPLVEVGERLRGLSGLGRPGWCWRPTTPLWSATEPSCGWVLPSLAGMFAMSPMTRTPGKPGDREVRLDIDPAAAALRKPGGAGDRRGHQPAAPDDAAGLDRRSVRQRHVAGPDRLHAGPQQELDAVLLEDPRRVGVTLVGEHLEELLSVVDEMDLGARRERRELVDHRRVDHLGQRAGDLDPGRPAADDDEIDGAFVGEMRVAVGFLERLDDPRPQAVRVVERVEREGVLGAGRPEEVRLRAGGQDDVVPGVGLAACAVVTVRATGSIGDDLGALRVERPRTPPRSCAADRRCRGPPASTSRPGRAAAGTGGSRSCRSG